MWTQPVQEDRNNFGTACSMTPLVSRPSSRFDPRTNGCRTRLDTKPTKKSEKRTGKKPPKILEYCGEEGGDTSSGKEGWVRRNSMNCKYGSGDDRRVDGRMNEGGERSLYWVLLKYLTGVLWDDTRSGVSRKLCPSFYFFFLSILKPFPSLRPTQS